MELSIHQSHNEVLKHIRSYEQDDPIHPNEYGYWEMAKQAVKVLDKALKASFYATDEAAVFVAKPMDSLSQCTIRTCGTARARAAAWASFPRGGVCGTACGCVSCGTRP